VAHHQKDQEGEDEKSRKPEKMPCILECTHQILSITPLPGLARLQASVTGNTSCKFERIGGCNKTVCEQNHKRMGGRAFAYAVQLFVSQRETRRSRVEAQSDTMNLGAQKWQEF
jgi:hypothetical protein